MILVVAAVAVMLVVLATRRRGGGRAGGMAPAAVVVLVGALLVLGLGGMIGARQSSEEDPPVVSITAPLDSTEVSSPITITVATKRMGAHHLDVTVDGACTAPNKVVPADASHRHLTADARRLTLELPPGEHTLCVQAADPAHRARAESDAVTILVGPA